MGCRNMYFNAKVQGVCVCVYTSEDVCLCIMVHVCPQKVYNACLKSVSISRLSTRMVDFEVT